SLDRLAELVGLAHRELSGHALEGPAPFPGPAVIAWWRYLFAQAANDTTFPYPARLQTWWWWARGGQVLGDLTNAVVDRITADARERGLSDEPDAFFHFWTISDVLAASAEALDRWLARAGIPFAQGPDAGTEATAPSPVLEVAGHGNQQGQEKWPRMEILVPLPDGRNLVLPIAKMTGTAVPGQGLKS